MLHGDEHVRDVKTDYAESKVDSVIVDLPIRMSLTVWLYLGLYSTDARPSDKV